MKKILFLLFTISLMASCTESNIKKVEEFTKVPMMVVKYQIDSTEATYTLLKLEQKTYLINNKTKDVEFAINNESDYSIAVFLLILCFVLFAIIAVVLN